MLNKTIAKTLTARYTLPNRTFGLGTSKATSNECRFRRLVTNIIVGGSLEENALAAQGDIFEKYNDCEAIADARLGILTAILQANGIRFAKRKAEYLIQTAINIMHQHKGQVPDTRAALERFRGVGRHVASIVLALGFGQNHFAVDLHVKRVAYRLGLVGKKDSERVIEKKLTEGVAPEDWAKYSRAFVDFGKEFCTKTPNCNKCFLKKKCEKVQEPIATAKSSAQAVKIGDGVYKIVAGSSAIPYNVTVKQGAVSCNCKGYRFRRTCSHLAEISQ